MSDDLLKRKGNFSGIPDFSSDPVTGFGFVFDLIYIGTENERILPIYTLSSKLKVNAAYYTSNARELVMSLDIPYKGTRWRFKVDFKAQQNPTNLYFGLTESTLRPLRLPSTPKGGPTYSTYSEYDRKKDTCSGEVGEAPFVTDALSNRFRETEYMLNLKADYALGNGKWRVMGGYEIQNLSYKTLKV
jgi:hypothetical protein